MLVLMALSYFVIYSVKMSPFYILNLNTLLQTLLIQLYGNKMNPLS